MNQNIIRLTFTYSSNIIAHTQSTGDQNAELQLIAKDYEGISERIQLLLLLNFGIFFYQGPIQQPPCELLL